MAGKTDDLKPMYLKGGRDLKGVESLEQFYGTRDYLLSIGIEPRYFVREKNMIIEVNEAEAFKRLRKAESEKEN